MLERALWTIGFVCLCAYLAVTVHAHYTQQHLEESFDQMVVHGDAVPSSFKEGDLVGRLEVPRLNLAVMVMEGVEPETLRLGAGHIPGTSLLGARGNIAIAAHRDSFFRPLSKIEEGDRIRFSTSEQSADYTVEWTKIVAPDDVSVIKPDGHDSLTLVTCYPFYYIGPAPQRFIVRAWRSH